MAIDKWSQNIDYTNKIKAEYMKIDKEIEEMEMSEELPAELTKEKAEAMFAEKEKYLQGIF